MITEDAGRVKTILITGSRSDPANLFHFIGQFGGLLRTLSPAMTDKEAAQKATLLGLMRGDDDPTIGEAKVAIEEFAAIRCNNQRSAVSTGIGCLVEPRY